MEGDRFALLLFQSALFHHRDILICRLRSCQYFQFCCVCYREVMWLQKLTDHICTIYILHCLNSCTTLFSIRTTALDKLFSSKHKKLPLDLPNLERKLDCYRMSSTNNLCCHLIWRWISSGGHSIWESGLPCRSSTFTRPSCVASEITQSAQTIPLAPLLCNPLELLQEAHWSVFEKQTYLICLFWKGRK